MILQEFILPYHLFCFRNIARIANANASAVLLMKCNNKLLKKLIWETLSKGGVSAVDIEKSTIKKITDIGNLGFYTTP